MDIRLIESVKAWGGSDFERVVKNEIEALNPELLPLQQGLVHASVANGDDFNAVILNTVEQGGLIFVKAGLFYSGIIAGCACSDDPDSGNETAEYCEALFEINKNSAATKIALVED